MTMEGGVFGICFMFLGGIFIAMGIYLGVMTRRIRNWTRIGGSVKSSKITEHYLPGKAWPQYYALELVVGYSIEGKEFEIKSSPEGKKHDEPDLAEKELKKYPVGRELPVYYNPKKPTTGIVLLHGNKGKSLLGVLIFVAIGLVPFVAGLLFFVKGLKS